MACDSSRFDAVIEKKVSLVLSVGALDMVNFGAKDTIPSNFGQRNIYVHNEQNGISALDALGKPFHDPEVTGTRMDELERLVQTNRDQKVKRFPYHINDPEFANKLVDSFLKISTKPSEDVGPRRDTSVESNEALQDKCISKIDISGCGAMYASPSNFPEAKPETSQRTQAILEQLKDQIEKAKALVGAGAGTGISAKFEEASLRKRVVWI